MDPEGRTLGVLGGGQLGRMMSIAAHRLGLRFAVLDPLGSQSPAGQVRTELFCVACTRHMLTLADPPRLTLADPHLTLTSPSHNLT